MFEGLLQPTHLIVILIMAMFFFGPKKLPELGRGIGEGMKAIRAGLRDGDAAAASPAEESETKS